MYLAWYQCAVCTLLGHARFLLVAAQGPFNNYVDKMRGGGVKNVCICLHSGYKNCPRKEGGGGKKLAILSMQLLNDPLCACLYVALFW
jgi:hypothetical protein